MWKCKYGSAVFGNVESGLGVVQEEDECSYNMILNLFYLAYLSVKFQLFCGQHSTVRKHRTALLQKMADAHRNGFRFMISHSALLLEKPLFKKNFQNFQDVIFSAEK